MVMCFSFGRGITATSWTQAEVRPIVELNKVWVDTLQSISELGNKVDPPPLSHDFAMDDSGLVDNQGEGDDEMEDEAEPGHAMLTEDGHDSGLVGNQDEVEDEVPSHAGMNEAGPGRAMMSEDRPDSDKENTAPGGGLPSPIMRIRISRETRRQMMPGTSYVRMQRL